MSLDHLDARQRAMLAEMGLRLLGALPNGRPVGGPPPAPPPAGGGGGPRRVGGGRSAPPGVTFRVPGAALETEHRPLPMHRRLALALPLALGIGLAACDLLVNEPDSGTGNPGTGLRIGVLTQPAVTPKPGDTLTFYVTFPDSTSERVQISWRTDPRGEPIPSGCTRGVCTKWIVPAVADTYHHYVTISANAGISRVPFTTVVP